MSDTTKPEHLPGLRVALNDTHVMIRMLARGEGKQEWLPGLLMFASWLQKEIDECVEGLRDGALRTDTPPLEDLPS